MLVKELEQTALQGRYAQLKYMFFYEETQTLKQRLSMGLSSNGKVAKHLINASENMLDYMDALHSKAAKFQNTLREYFDGSFASLVKQLQTVLTLEVVAVFTSFIDSVREALIKLRLSISECEAAASAWRNRLIGVTLAFSVRNTKWGWRGKRG